MSPTPTGQTCGKCTFWLTSCGVIGECDAEAAKFTNGGGEVIRFSTYSDQDASRCEDFTKKDEAS